MLAIKSFLLQLSHIGKKCKRSWSYLYTWTASQTSPQFEESAADFVLERGLALVMHVRGSSSSRSSAGKDAAAIGPGSGGGGCVVMATVGCERHDGGLVYVYWFV